MLIPALVFTLTIGLILTHDFQNKVVSTVTNNKLASSCQNYIGVDRAGLTLCVKNTILKEVKDIGYVKTAHDLESSVKEYPEINQVCHPYAHYIGIGALQETHSIVRALGDATSFCEWGYLHGMNVEASLLYNGRDLLKVMLDGCEYLKNKNGNYFECAHGMGDSFQSKYQNITTAYKWCDMIPDVSMHENCSQGATNYWADHIVLKYKSAPKLLSKDEYKLLTQNPYSFCEQISNLIDRGGCFDYAVRLDQGHIGGIKVFEKYCQKYSQEDLSNCFKGIARELAYAEGYSLSDVYQTCLSSKDFHAISTCVVELVSSRTQMFRDNKGMVLKNLCTYARDSHNPGLIDGCKEATADLKPYFSGTFKL